MLPFFLGFAGLIYAASSIILGLIFLRDARRVYNLDDGKDSDDAARQLFKFSILYLFVVFAVLLVENLVGAETLGSFGLWL